MFNIAKCFQNCARKSTCTRVIRNNSAHKRSTTTSPHTRPCRFVYLVCNVHAFYGNAVDASGLFMNLAWSVCAHLQLHKHNPSTNTSDSRTHIQQCSLRSVVDRVESSYTQKQGHWTGEVYHQHSTDGAVPAVADERSDNESKLLKCVPPIYTCTNARDTRPLIMRVLERTHIVVCSNEYVYNNNMQAIIAA